MLTRLTQAETSFQACSASPSKVAFGICVAHNVQKVQLVLLAGCHDESSTRYAVPRFFDWLIRSGEASFLAVRARGRNAIIEAIAA
jgi:hypothetical protein